MSATAIAPRRRRRWLRNGSLLAGIALVTLSVVASVAAPLFAPSTPTGMSFGDELIGPSATFPLGTDELGRDVFSRLLYGGRASLGVVVPSVFLAAIVGLISGMAMSYFGGILDLLLMRVYDVILAFPALLLAVVMIAFLGPTRLNLVLSLAILNVSQFAVLARSTTLALKESEYVQAAVAVGAGSLRILWVHLFRNLAPMLITQIALALSVSILVEAALSFLGIGIQPPTPSWGGMLNAAQTYMVIAPWLALAPGITIMIVVSGLNLIADGLRDALAVRQV